MNLPEPTSPAESTPGPAHTPVETKAETVLADVTPEQIQAVLAQTHQAAECVALAGWAEQRGDIDLVRKCWAQAVALDRHCQAALLGMAAQASDDGDAASTFAFLEEAERAGVLPEEARSVHRDLLTRVMVEPDLQNYLRTTGRLPLARTEQPRSIVLVTNLYPPQELGGYGRMMWEFAHGLLARGHRVRVLTSDVTEFAHQALTAEEQAMEPHVLRTLQLLGRWVGGKGEWLEDRQEMRRRARDNAARLRTALAKSGADLVLAGNLDFLGLTVLQAALAQNIPVLHALANAAPGYGKAEVPAGAAFWVAPCSDWNGQVLREAGYAPARIETLYPGARLDRFFRLFLPDTRRLRICYASLVLPYKGADTLVQALGQLHAAGIDFTAEIAGDAPDAAFLHNLHEQVRAAGMEDRVRFTGFLDRAALADLFARNNVLVFPSKFEEPFGISQVEAMAAGLVVVSSGTGGAREIVRAGVDGLLFAAGDAAALTAKLVQLAREPGLMAQLQRRAQARAARFSVEQAVLKIESLAAEMRAVQQAAKTGLPLEGECAASVAGR